MKIPGGLILGLIENMSTNFVVEFDKANFVIYTTLNDQRQNLICHCEQILFCNVIN